MMVFDPHKRALDPFQHYDGSQLRGGVFGLEPVDFSFPKF